MFDRAVQEPSNGTLTCLINVFSNEPKINERMDVNGFNECSIQLNLHNKLIVFQCVRVHSIYKSKH